LGLKATFYYRNVELTADLAQPEKKTYQNKLCHHTVMAVANPLFGQSALGDIVHPQFHQTNFPAETFIKNELGIKLDQGLDHLFAARHND
jgi:hypothetical protein